MLVENFISTSKAEIITVSIFFIFHFFITDSVLLTVVSTNIKRMELLCTTEMSIDRFFLTISSGG
jgi:hypothetical protein